MAIRCDFRLVCCWLFAALALLAGVWDSAAGGQELRIETDVYVGDETESKSHHVTLFDSGTVYDFSEMPAQITIFRPPTATRPGQFVLLDLETRRRTEVSTQRVETLMAKLSQWAAGQDNPILQFSAEPEFIETFDESSGTLTLTHALWDYTVATVPAEDTEKLSRYREFTDWYSRLHAMLQGALPPGPRLELNAAFERHGIVPVEIRRTVESSKPQLRATHLFSWRLSRADLARLEETRKFLTSFEKVDNKEFLAQRADKGIVRGQSQ
ncbi:MAG: hypothetical protein MK171_06115 [Pirellulales bacterium]|nr:hypothetical protein [Pirellulales bacterium]